MSIADNFKVSKGKKKEEDKFYALDSKDVWIFRSHKL